MLSDNPGTYSLNDERRVATHFLRDRLDLLQEIESIGKALDVIDQRHGSNAAIADARHRLRLVRIAVISQLHALLDAADSAAMMVH